MESESIIHADVFFFITSIAVVVLSIILAVVLIYAIRIFRNADYVIKKVKEESDNVSADIAAARQRIRDQGMKFSGFFMMLKSLFSTQRHKKKSQPQSRSDEE